MRLQAIIEKHWYTSPNFMLSCILWPLSLAYRAISAVRKKAYALGWLKSYRLAVPLVVVGNISVGGAGKTPLCKYLAAELIRRGVNTGIILRGYKGSNTTPRIVNPDDASDLVGDEALIYAQAGYKVAIARDRVAAGELLLKHNPQTQLIIADDGMQHYRLKRDLEICVVDSTRLFGNRQLIPMGPLREDLNRLSSVDAIVVNGHSNQVQQGAIWSKQRTAVYVQELLFEGFYNPLKQQQATIADLNKLNCMAIAAIGNPQRFFDYLQNLGLKFKHQQAFPDHYHYQSVDIDPKYAIITTEKDYTKLAKFKHANIWVTQVSASLANEQLINTILDLKRMAV